MDAPAQGQPVDQLWHFVAELVEFCNALENMKVQVNTPTPTTGKLYFNGDACTLVLG